MNIIFNIFNDLFKYFFNIIGDLGIVIILLIILVKFLFVLFLFK